MTSTAQNTSTEPRDALVFVPGLGKSKSLASAHIAELLCWELNQQAPDRATTYASTPTSAGAEVVHRISRTDGRGVVDVLDVYTYDSVAELDRNTTSTNPLWRVLSLGATVIAAVGVLFGVMVNWNRKAKPRGQLLQAFTVLLVVLCIVVYFGIAVFALVEAVATIVRGETTEPVVSWPQWIVLVGAVIGGLVPTLREKINWLGERSVQMARFTYTGVLRNRLSGGLQDLIDRIARRPDVDRIHLLGYSFGSLVAFETVFPQSADPGPSLRLVTTLTSIGSPFDLVRMVRPTYRQGRTITDDIKPRWINIYQPIDVLGSNFRDEAKLGDAEVGFTSTTAVQRKPDANLAWNADLTRSPINLLMLRSISVHAGYWDEASTAHSALGLVIREITKSAPILK